jgi:hypothetical protein
MQMTMDDHAKTVFTPLDLAHALNISYSAASARLKRSPSIQKNDRGYYTWNKTEFDKVVKALSRDPT